MFINGMMTNTEVLPGPGRRRRWTPAEKLGIIAETREPGVTVSLVARRYGIAPNQIFLWRRLANQGALKAAPSDEEVSRVPDYHGLVDQVRELQRLLGKKTLEAEMLREALDHANGKKQFVRAISHAMVADVSP
jgi:transposase